MESWFIYSLLTAITIGGMTALYKVPASKGYNKFAYSFYGFLTATILSLIAFRDSIQADFHTVLFGFLWGTGYALVALLQMELLKKLDTSASFPLTSMSSHVLVVILGFTFFSDQISALQMVAIALTFVVGGFYNHANKHITLTNGLLPIAGGVVLLSTFCKFVQKYASVSTDLGNFIFWQLFFAAVASICLMALIPRSERKAQLAFSKGLIGWSVLLGALNFVATSAIVKALSTGPFSLVYTINSFYILFASIIAWKFFGEQLTRRKVAFLLLAAGIIILIKIG
jgi:drug/metabolite transporter (DMT)-like permease